MRKDKHGIHTDSRDDNDFGAEFFAQIVDYIVTNYEPGDIFSEEELSAWAEGSGYVLDEN